MRKSANRGRPAPDAIRRFAQPPHGRPAPNNLSLSQAKLDGFVQLEKTGEWVRPHLHVACDQYGHIVGFYLGIEDMTSDTQKHSFNQTE